MRFMIVLMVLSSLALADVIPGTLHRSDAQLVDNIMEETGVSNGSVNIVYSGDLTVYGVIFPGDYFDWDSDDDRREVSSFFVAVALVSVNTSWHSDLAVAVYEDIMVGLTTENCREVVRLMNEGYNVTEFLENNMIMGDWDECASEFDL